MGTEIERKFRVDVSKLPDFSTWSGQQELITQGYLSYDPQTRVRLIEYAAFTSTQRESRAAYLTIKGKGTLTRGEYEWQIPTRDAEELLTTVTTIKKIRYVGEDWEIDHFLEPMYVMCGQSGVLYTIEDLWLAEIELSREDEEFELPPWVSIEVTHDVNYKNMVLACSKKAHENALIRNEHTR